MKIGILGPVTTSKYFGGVAIFDEEIANGFEQNNCQVVLLTDQKEEKINKDKFNIKKINYINATQIFKNDKFDLIIASLGYAKYLLFDKSNSYKIYFLHGFFNSNYYGKLKSELAVIYQKILIKKCDKILANSNFTKMINSNFFGINADAVIRLGVSSSFYNNIIKRNVKKEPNTILYAGRLVSVKGVEKLIKSLIILQKNNIEYKLLIAGSGPDELELKKIVDEYHLNVVFLGRITQENLAHYYSLSEIFVSLNPSEPFGIVFPEALLSQCKIVCPYTGGQVEYLSDYSKSVAFVDETDENSISNGIKNMLMNGEQPILNDEQMKSFTYKEITRKIINCYKLRKK